MTLNKPCLDCGEATKTSRCDECEELRVANLPTEARREWNNRSSTSRGYNGAWKRLSKRARELQPFCLHCHSTDDLQADHTPEAWERHEKGLAIRLQDIQVLCGPCNRKAGAARGNTIERTTSDSNASTR